MHLQDGDHLKARKLKLLDTLERIRVTLALSHASFADVLELTSSQYERIRSGDKDLSAYSGMKLADHLNTNLDQLMSGEVNFSALSAWKSGDNHFLPKRYTIAPRSRKRTSINLLQFLEDFHGWQFRKRILRRFSISDAAIENPDEWINVLFLSDLCSHLIQEGFTEEQLFSMGTYSVVTNYNSHLGEAYRKLSSTKEIIQQCFEVLVEFYDRNVDYRIVKLTDHEAIIEAKPNKEVAEALKVHKIGNTHYCKTKAGVFASFPGYLNLPFASVVEQSCSHKGESSCRYSIDFNLANRVSQSRMNRKRVRNYRSSGLP